jgi:hypothetical protein
METPGPFLLPHKEKVTTSSLKFEDENSKLLIIGLLLNGSRKVLLAADC